MNTDGRQLDNSGDHVTGLYTRIGFERLLRMAIAGAQVTNPRHTVCYLDLDHFKTVNDECSYEAGAAESTFIGAKSRAIPVYFAGMIDTVGPEHGKVIQNLVTHCPAAVRRPIHGPRTGRDGGG